MELDEDAIATRLENLHRRLEVELDSDFKDATLRLALAATSLLVVGLICWHYVWPMRETNDSREL